MALNDLLPTLSDKPRSIDEEASLLAPASTGFFDYTGAKNTMGWLDNAMRTVGKEIGFGAIESPYDVNTLAQLETGGMGMDELEGKAALDREQPTAKVYQTEAEAKEAGDWFKGLKFTPGMSQARIQAMAADADSRNIAQVRVDNHEPGISSVVGFFAEALGMADPTWGIPFTGSAFAVGRMGSMMPRAVRLLGPRLSQGVQFGLDNAISTAMTRPFVEMARDKMGQGGDGTVFNRVVQETIMAGAFGGVLGAGVFGKIAKNAADRNAAFTVYAKGLDTAYEQFSRGGIIDPKEANAALKGMLELSKYDARSTAPYLQRDRHWGSMSEADFANVRRDPSLPGPANEDITSGLLTQPSWDGSLPRSGGKPPAGPGVLKTPPAEPGAPQATPGQVIITRPDTQQQRLFQIQHEARLRQQAAGPMGKAHGEVLSLADGIKPVPYDAPKTPLHNAYSELRGQHIWERDGILEYAVGATDVLDGLVIRPEYKAGPKGRAVLTEEFERAVTSKSIAGSVYTLPANQAWANKMESVGGVLRVPDAMAHGSEKGKKAIPWDQVEQDLMDRYPEYFREGSNTAEEFFEKLAGLEESKGRALAAAADMDARFERQVKRLTQEYDSHGTPLDYAAQRVHDLRDIFERQVRGALDDAAEQGMIPEGLHASRDGKNGEWIFHDGRNRVVEVNPEYRGMVTDTLDNMHAASERDIQSVGTSPEVDFASPNMAREEAARAEHVAATEELQAGGHDLDGSWDAYHEDASIQAMVARGDEIPVAEMKRVSDEHISPLVEQGDVLEERIRGRAAEEELVKYEAAMAESKMFMEDAARHEREMLRMADELGDCDL